MATFSERLKGLRTANNLTQKSLAEKVEMGRKTIQSYELESRKPTADAVLALAKYFDVSMDYLMGRSNNPTWLE